MIIFLLAIAAIPITAIVADAYVKSRRLNGHPADVSTVIRELSALRKENDELKERVKNLEVIVSNINVLEEPDYTKQIELKARKLKDEGLQ
jgi:hypothetical protein